MAGKTPSSNLPSSKRLRLNTAQVVGEVLALQRSHRLAEAEALCRDALRHEGKSGPLLHILGTLRLERGDLVDAVKSIERALKEGPEHAQMYVDLGIAWRAQGKLDKSHKALRRAIAVDARWSPAHFHMAQTLTAMGDADAAIAAYDVCLAIDPTDAAAYINLGALYKARGQYDAALDSYDSALVLQPGMTMILRNIASTFREQGLLHPALACLERAVTLAPDDKALKSELASDLLQVGAFAQGWATYEDRFDNPHDLNLSLRPVPPAYWGGEDLVGKRILIWTEQGVGDEILHGSFVPEIAARAAHCVLECSARMAPIFARSFPGVEVVARADYLTAVTPASAVDYQISIASLGQYLRPDFASFPKHAGYLKADPVQTAACRARYDAVSPGQRLVGLAWRSKNEKIGAFKSLSLMDLAPILQVPGLTFVNLQYGDCAAELAEVKAKLGVDIVQDPAVDPLKDMDAAFAQVAAMDLVISTSNTTVHTAGALNVPVWLMLPYAKGTLWYWFVKRPDSPWYPSARLIREAKLTPDRPWWQDVVARSAADLAAWKKQS